MNFQKFKKKYQKIPVEHYPNNVSDSPVVSVCVQTYQHADYIEECLKGILMQETNFPYEILLGEDASTDGTRQICIEYAEKYPEKIRLFLHSRENNIQIGGHPTGRFNFLYNLYSATGTYIALCEGDDYWVDPLKLQKQVEFMEANPDYGLVFTDLNVLNQKNNLIEKSIFNNHPDKYSIHSNVEDVVISTGFTAPCTWLFRKKMLSIPDQISSYSDGSFVFMIHFYAKTDVQFLTDTTAVYRKLEESASHTKSLTKKYSRRKGLLNTQLDYIDKLNLSEETRSKVLQRHYRMVLPLIILLSDKEELKIARNLLKKNKMSLKRKMLLYLSKFSSGRRIYKAIYSFKKRHKFI